MQVLNPENRIDRIISIFQTEDLLRAHLFNIDEIIKQQSKKLNKSQIDSVRAYLKGISKSMHDEGIKTSGHLKLVHQLMDEFVDVQEHNHLGDKHLELFEQLLGIFKIDADDSDKVKKVIQACFEFIYTLYLQKIGNKELKQSTIDVAHICSLYLNNLDILIGE